MDRPLARRVSMHSIPVGFLRVALALGALALVYGMLAQRTLPTALPRAGCLATLCAALCEWRVLSWRIGVENAAQELEGSEIRDRQALQVHRVQVARTAPWIHALFLAGTLSWGFGDLLWS